MKEGRRVECFIPRAPQLRDEPDTFPSPHLPVYNFNPFKYVEQYEKLVCLLIKLLLIHARLIERKKKRNLSIIAILIVFFIYRASIDIIFFKYNYLNQLFLMINVIISTISISIQLFNYSCTTYSKRVP